MAAPYNISPKPLPVEIEKGFVKGAPELMAEVASSSESYDLHSKKADYELAGVREYLVLVLRQQRVAWFVRRDGRFVTREPDADGISRSLVFPGLWLDPIALLRGDTARVQEILQQGLHSAEHAQFVEQLNPK